MEQVHQKLVDIAASDFKEETFKKGSTTFSYLVANESAKKMVVLVHGVTGNKLDMVAVGHEYVRRGYAVYAPDLPGHGSAKPIATKSFDELGTWLKNAIAATGRVPDVLMGNSFASAICYDFAQQGYLHKKTWLVLACPTPDIGWASRTLRRASYLLPAAIATGLYNTSWAIGARASYLLVSHDISIRDWLYESERHKIPFIDAKVANVMSTLLATHNPYLGTRLPVAVQQQVIVVMGKQDNVVTKRALPLLHKILPHARFIIVPGVGHILHFEAFRQLGAIDYPRLD